MVGWMKDDHGRYEFLSENLEKRFQVRLDDWRGKTDFDLQPREIAEILHQNDLAVLERKIEEHGLPRAPFEWYLDLRRYGSVPHSGFGIGVERTVAWICGLSHLREASPFPRMIHRLTP